MYFIQSNIHASSNYFNKKDVRRNIIMKSNP